MVGGGGGVAPKKVLGDKGGDTREQGKGHAFLSCVQFKVVTR